MIFNGTSFIVKALRCSISKCSRDLKCQNNACKRLTLCCSKPDCVLINKCRPGTYGPPLCRKKCNCLSECNSENGKCLGKCKSGFYGESCDIEFEDAKFWIKKFNSVLTTTSPYPNMTPGVHISTGNTFDYCLYSTYEGSMQRISCLMPLTVICEKDPNYGLCLNTIKKMVYHKILS